jgi:hypothetical protein
MRVGDRAIGIVVGILLGLAIVIGFVFLGSGDTIDAPSLSGNDQPQQQQEKQAPVKTAPAQAEQ